MSDLDLKQRFLVAQSETSTVLSLKLPNIKKVLLISIWAFY